MFSNPMSPEVQERVNNLITEILSTFSTQFPIAYAVSLVQQCKLEVNPPTDELSECLLETAPPASEPLKRGFLTKRGDAHKNWKRRHCVAYNKADNFRIDYCEGEGGKVKGSINCAGYSVEKFNEEDETQYGPFGIKLVPWQRVRRTWYIRCENEEDRTAWIKVFENACWKAVAPEDPNPLIAAAFRSAFETLRWRYGYWGWYYSYGTEDERLGDFIRQVLARDIVDAVIGGIAEGFFRAGLVNMVETSIATTVRAAVSAAWKSAVAAVNAIAASLETLAKENLSPIFEQQRNIKDRIVSSIGSVTNPFLSEYGGKVMRPVLDGCAVMIARSFSESIKSLHGALKEKMTRDELSAAKRSDTLRVLDNEADWWWSGPLSTSKRIAWDMYSSAPSELFSACGYSLWSLRQQVVDFLEELFHRATYSLGKLASENSAVPILDHCNEIFRRYIHDAKVYIRFTLLTILRRFLNSPITQYIVTPAQKLVEPIQAMIDAIPIPGLSTLFSLTDLLGEVVTETVDGALNAAVSGYLSQTDAQIDATSSELVF